MVKVVLVCTSASELNGHPTGLWLEECAVPYYMFKEKGFEVVLASPAGGPIPIDQNSLGGDFFVADAKTFMHDAEAVGALSHTVKLDAVDWSTVDAIYLAGGHGTCVDFINNAALKSAIETVFNANKIVACDCHGPIALAECTKADGSPLVKDKVVTGFADSEEVAVQLDKIVPFLVESKFREQGAKYEKAGDWQVKVCVDGNLITGQNPGKYL
jgi:putative intracellular protease/amidase